MRSFHSQGALSCFPAETNNGDVMKRTSRLLFRIFLPLALLMVVVATLFLVKGRTRVVSSEPCLVEPTESPVCDSGSVDDSAVLRALRWLKKHQHSSGCWTGGWSESGPGSDMDVAAGMTGLALLPFLAYGQTTESPEFGDTVANALSWLVENQLEGGGWNRKYQHAIATFAMAEAYALMRIPPLRPTVERGLDIIIAGQNSQGGWRYELAPSEPSSASASAWCCLALKAGQMAGLDRPGMEDAMRQAVEGWKTLFNESAGTGTFQYMVGNDAYPGLTGSGVYSLQLLGAANLPETRAAVRYLVERRSGFDWENARWQDVYYWYFDTEALYHEGGTIWREWSRAFSREIYAAQRVIPFGLADTEGRMASIGYWCKKNHRVMDTALCTLMLVWRRTLPVFDRESAPELLESEPRDEADRTVDIIIEL